MGLLKEKKYKIDRAKVYRWADLSYSIWAYVECVCVLQDAWW